MRSYFSDMLGRTLALRLIPAWVFIVWFGLLTLAVEEVSSIGGLAFAGLFVVGILAFWTAPMPEWWGPAWLRDESPFVVQLPRVESSEKIRERKTMKVGKPVTPDSCRLALVIRRHPLHTSGVDVESGRVPPEVEEYLISVISRAGVLTGGQRGAAVAAQRMKTVVQERATVGRSLGNKLLDDLLQVFPQVTSLSTGAALERFAIPVGRTGLQQIVVDIVSSEAPAGDNVESGAGPIMIRAYGKEGLLSRNPTARVADQVADLFGR